MSKKSIKRAEKFVIKVCSCCDDFDDVNQHHDFSNSNLRYYVFREYDTGRVYSSEESFLSKEGVNLLIEDQLSKCIWDKIVIFDTKLNKIVKPHI